MHKMIRGIYRSLSLRFGKYNEYKYKNTIYIYIYIYTKYANKINCNTQMIAMYGL